MHQYSIEKTELDKVLDKFEFAMNCWNYKIPENLDVIDNARHGSKNHVRSSKKDETHTFPKSGTNTVLSTNKKEPSVIKQIKYNGFMV